MCQLKTHNEESFRVGLEGARSPSDGVAFGWEEAGRTVEAAPRNSYVESDVLTCVDRRLVESPVGLCVWISQFVATSRLGTFRGSLRIARNLRHPCLDAYIVGVPEENTSRSYASSCLALCISASAGLQ